MSEPQGAFATILSTLGHMEKRGVLEAGELRRLVADIGAAHVGLLIENEDLRRRLKEVGLDVPEG